MSKGDLVDEVQVGWRSRKTGEMCDCPVYERSPHADHEPVMVPRDVWERSQAVQAGMALLPKIGPGAGSVTEDRAIEDWPIEDLPRWPGWQAGMLTPCDGSEHHEPDVIHVVVRCGCGASFMSTDASIAFGMASDHRRRAQ